MKKIFGNQSVLNSLFLTVLLLFGTVSPARSAIARFTNLDQSLTKYSQSQLVTMKVEEKQFSNLLGKEKKVAGVVSLSKGKFRYDIKGNEDSMILFDGKYLWTVQFPNKDLGGRVQITKTRSGKVANSQLILNLLGEPRNVYNQFTVQQESAGAEESVYVLTPKNRKSNLKHVSLFLNNKNLQIQRLKYRDDVENEVDLTIKDTDFVSKPTGSVFEFTPPKNSQVIEL